MGLLESRVHWPFCMARAMDNLAEGRTTCYRLGIILQRLGASVLLDDTENFVGEKSWTIELELVKSDLESVCPETVSCANILAVVATDSVLLVLVDQVRKDSLSATKAAATGNIRAPYSSVSTRSG
ncbi:hypothetical protein Peur_017880 [Populus x canadensis]